MEQAKSQSGDENSKAHLFTQKEGVRHFATKRIDESALSAFLCIISNSVLNAIINGINAEFEDKGVKFRATKNELLAFPAVQYCRGISARGVAVRDLCSREFGIAIIAQLSCKIRFEQTMRYLQFDHRATRRERLSNDISAPIRDIFERFVQNSFACYAPAQYVTIDEQLLPCRSRCKFIQYMPNKPDKFGKKFWVTVDVDTKYVVNMFPYLGKDVEKKANELQGEFVAKQLFELLFNKGHTITMDNFYISKRLGEFLLSKKTTMIGTIKNKRELPSMVNKSLPLHDSNFWENNSGCTLTLYQCKSCKNVHF